MIVTPCNGASVAAAGLRLAKLAWATIDSRPIGAGCATVATAGGSDEAGTETTRAGLVAGAGAVMLAITTGVGCAVTIGAGFDAVMVAAGVGSVAVATACMGAGAG